MSWLDDFSDFAVHTIVWEPVVARDAHGKPITFGTAQTFSGYRTYTLQRVPAAAGGTVVDVLSPSQIIILGAPAITPPDDRVYVQGETTYPPVVNITKYTDENSEQFVVVMLGSHG